MLEKLVKLTLQNYNEYQEFLFSANCLFFKAERILSYRGTEIYVHVNAISSSDKNKQADITIYYAIYFNSTYTHSYYRYLDDVIDKSKLIEELSISYR